MSANDLEKRPERSQQWLWQQRMKKAGRCPNCGSHDVLENYILCRQCVKKRKAYYQDKIGVDKTNSVAKLQSKRRGVSGQSAKNIPTVKRGKLNSGKPSSR